MPRPPSRGKRIAGGKKAAVRNWRVTREVWVAARAAPGIGVDREVGKRESATVGASGLEEVGMPRRLMEWAGEGTLGVRALGAPQAVEQDPELERVGAPAVVAGVVADAGRALRC